MGRTSQSPNGKHESFPEALASLLRSRGLRVPSGLEKAPPSAYGGRGPELADELRGLSDDDLLVRARQVAGYAKRQEARARDAWERSPLIAEIKRRKLALPPRPARVVGVAVPMKKPLSEWSDSELLRAAREWSRRGQT